MGPSTVEGTHAFDSAVQQIINQSHQPTTREPSFAQKTSFVRLSDCPMEKENHEIRFDSGAARVFAHPR